MSNDRLDYCRVMNALNQLKSDLINFRRCITELGMQYTEKVKRLDASGLAVQNINEIYSPYFYKATMVDIDALIVSISSSVMKLDEDIAYYTMMCKKGGQR